MIFKSIFFRAIEILDTNTRKKLLLILIAQFLMSFLDLVAIIFIGALGALSIQGIQQRDAGDRVSIVLNILKIENYSFEFQVTFLGILACFFLVLKTVSSGVIIRKTFLFLSYKSAKIASDLVEKILSFSLVEIQKRTSQQTLWIITEGARSIILGVVGTSVSIFADGAMLVILFAGLFIVDSFLALVTFFIFLLMALLLTFVLQGRAKKIGIRISDLHIRGNEKTLEVLGSYRELVVKNRRYFYSREIRDLKFSFAKATAELNFQPFISKYIIEMTAILTAFLAAGYAFFSKDAVNSIAVLVVFLAASSRVAPGVLRIQQGILLMKSSSGSAETTFALLDELKSKNTTIFVSERPDFEYADFKPEIEIENLSFSYSGRSSNFSIKKINMKVGSGERIAIVGSSGAGKSTLIDLLLGILIPNEGKVSISGRSPGEASRIFGGAISYVPQDVLIISGTIRENVGLGFEKELATDHLVWEALEMAQLKDVVMNLPEGLDTYIGERGSLLSGGQRQRLGIARALFTKPKLIVFDEATSALDNQTEALITSSIESLEGKVTVVVVAHRLSTVRKAKKVYYVEEGKIVASGTFDEVRSIIPNFNIQASLLEI